MKLYHHPFSSNARKAVMTALLLESPVELEVVDLTKGAQKTPEYLKLNPNGKVPTLVDGDFSIWESPAIMVYLAEKTPGNTLYPTELKVRTEVQKWLFWAANELSPQVAILNFENMLKKMFGWGEPDLARIAHAEKQLKPFAAVLDAHLSTRAWVAGDRLTLADVSIACSLMTMVPAKLPLQEFSHIQSWFARMQELPAWKKTNPQM